MLRRTSILLVVSLSMVACDQSPATERELKGLEARVAKLEAKGPGATLSVTWLVAGQPPTTTQTSFPKMPDCERAKAVALDQADSVRAQRVRENATAKAEVAADFNASQARGVIISQLGPGDIEKLKGQPVPDVSAVCL